MVFWYGNDPIFCNIRCTIIMAQFLYFDKIPFMLRGYIKKLT